MKAVVYKTFGPPDVLKLVHNHPLPPRSAGQVLVKVKSTSVNPVDFKIRNGSIPVVAKKEKVRSSPLPGLLEAVLGRLNCKVLACTCRFLVVTWLASLKLLMLTHG